VAVTCHDPGPVYWQARPAFGGRLRKDFPPVSVRPARTIPGSLTTSSGVLVSIIAFVGVRLYPAAFHKLPTDAGTLYHDGYDIVKQLLQFVRHDRLPLHPSPV